MLKTTLMALLLTLPALSAFAETDDGGPCVEVEIGGVKTPSLKCINQRLQQQVERIHPAQNIPPLDATSAAVKLGGYNETALSQQFGSNFGKSVYPYRSVQIYNSPLTGKP